MRSEYGGSPDVNIRSDIGAKSGSAPPSVRYAKEAVVTQAQKVN